MNENYGVTVSPGYQRVNIVLCQLLVKGNSCVEGILDNND